MLSSRCALALALQLSVTALASARETDPVTAEVLFQEARQLLKQGKLEQACPKFLESERLDPATATLLAVATCHEQQGLLASAWAEFTEAAGRARQEGRKDRQRLALDRVKSLEPRLSTLNIVVAPELMATKGLWIRRDGVDIGTAVYNRALPIDGGVHTVELGAPGHLSETLSVTVGRAGDRAALTLDSLRREPASAPTVPTASVGNTASAVPAAPPLPQTGLSGTQSVGVGLGVVGVGTLTVGAGFLVGALIKKDQSNAYCEGQACTPRGLELRADAVDRGNLATAFGIAGTVLAAAGLALYWTGGASAEQGQDARASVSLQTARDGVMANVQVGF